MDGSSEAKGYVWLSLEGIGALHKGASLGGAGTWREGLGQLKVEQAEAEWAMK